MAVSQRLVVVGGVAAGMSAASKARRVNPELEIVAFERSGYVSYGACGLPYLISGVVPDPHDLIARTPEQFARQGIEARVHHEVVAMDAAAKTVTVRDLERGEEFTLGYGVLVLAAGGTPARPPIPGMELGGIFTLRTVEDGLAIREFLARERPRRAVIVGGGYIGLEMAEAFHRLGLETAVLEMLPQVLPNFDADMAGLVVEELERQGVAIFTEHPVEGFEGDGRVRQVAAAGQTFPADIALLAVGVRPNITLAREAGIALGPTGAVAVDDHLRTNLPDVYAAGDVAEVKHLVTGKPAYIPLGTTANKQGRVAGENAAGGDATFRGVVGTAVVKIFDLEAARTGLTEREAREQGYDVRAIKIQHGTRAHYYPGGSPLHVKLIVEGNGRLLGAQMIGREGAAKRIDVIAAALQAGWTVEELSRLDLSYAPPFSPVWDPILVAANVALR